MAYLLPCCCICDSILLDIQHDHVLKKLRGVGGGGGGGGGSKRSWAKVFATMLLHL